MLISAITMMILALTFYSIGVWGEKLQKRLKSWHTVFFGLGLICDTTGTLVMESIAKNSPGSGDFIHLFTGAAALILMLVHFLWALWVLYKKDEQAQAVFHHFSIIVWLIWLIPFFSGVVMNAK